MGTGWGQLVSWLWCLISPPPPPFFFFIVCLLNERGGATAPVIDSYILPSQRSWPCLCEDSPLSVLYSTPGDESFLISCLCRGSSGVCQSVSQVGSSQRCKNTPAETPPVHGDGASHGTLTPEPPTGSLTRMIILNY